MTPRTVLAVVSLLLTPLTATAQPSSASALVGAWTLNADLSDKPSTPGEGGDARQGDGHGRRGGGPRGGGGGFGRGGGSGRGGGGQSRGGNQEDRVRKREAMQRILDAAQRLTITATESMVIITTNEGLTTRLSPDNSKIKDDSTGIERRTRWEGAELVTEISGLSSGRITETYALNAEAHQLTVTLAFDGDRSPQHRVYDALPR